jgi:hypothetical protein
MLEPKNFDVDGKTYVLTKFPATVGREILMQYPTSVVPKLGDYKTNHALMLRILSFVGVPIEGRDEPLMLTSEALVNNHVRNAEVLVQIEWAMISHNFDFFGDGRASGILRLLMDKAQALTSETLTKFVAALSEKGSPP